MERKKKEKDGPGSILKWRKKQKPTEESKPEKVNLEETKPPEAKPEEALKKEPHSEEIKPKEVKQKEPQQKKTKSKTDPVEIDPEEKVGIIARTLLREALESGKAPEKEVNLMQTKDYSSMRFGVDFPLLTKERKERYYAKPIVIRGVEYWMCSEWYIGDKPLLLEWLREKGVIK